MLGNGMAWAFWLCASQPASLMVHESIALTLNNAVTLDHIIYFNAPVLRMVITFLLHGTNLILSHAFFPWEEVMRARVVPWHWGFSLWGWQPSRDGRKQERVPWRPVERAVQAETEAGCRFWAVVSSSMQHERGAAQERTGMLTPDFHFKMLSGLWQDTQGIWDFLFPLPHLSLVTCKSLHFVKLAPGIASHQSGWIGCRWWKSQLTFIFYKWSVEIGILRLV